MDFDAAFRQWVSEPQPPQFEALRNAVRQHPSFHSNPDFRPVLKALQQGNYVAARDLILARMPGLCLSPTAHTLLSRAYLGLGEDRRADFERAVARGALQGILTSGKGTEESPWQVLRIGDEYDVIRAMDERVEAQQQAAHPFRHIDRLDTTAGNSYWFEVGTMSQEAAR